MSSGRLARSRHAISRTRQAEGPIRSFGVDARPGGLVPPQPAGWAHLVSVRTGIAELRCERIRAFVTPGVAYWIPNGTTYALDLRTHTRLRILYADDCVYPARAFGAVAMRPLLRELLERAMASGFLDARNPGHDHVLSVIGDELAGLSPASAANVLVFPRDPALCAAAERLVANPDHGRSVAGIAESAGMSLRTFERRFANETGLAPSEWLRRARLLAALVMLSSGASVTDAGLACGYTSISAFISAFRRVHGVTPGSISSVR
jgi:AraC-like DNA-binding protein